MNPTARKRACVWLLGALGAPLAAQDAAGAAIEPIEQRIAAVLAEIQPARLEATVRTLVGFGSRHVLSRTDSETEGTGAARVWLEKEFAAIGRATGGRLVVTRQAATVPCARPGMPAEIPIVNVIATLPGTTDPERIYVVGGHYDSRNGDGADGRRAAPGACDDASGTAVALEACRVMATRDWGATLVFVAYDAEEQGLLGSAAHAAELAKAGARVDGMITCDIVGNTLGMDGQRHDRTMRCFSYAASGSDTNGRSLARAASRAARLHVPGFELKLVFRGDRYGRGGDHRSFFEQGYPGVRFSELREDFSRQHADVVQRDGKAYGDLPEWVDFAYVANVTRVVVATLGELAMAPPPPPRVVSAQLRRDRYDTELVFELPPGAVGCEFVVRETTEPDWTAVVANDAAAVRPQRGGRLQATLPGVCLDDVVVGVRCIGPDGSRSRVVTPPEPDRFDQRRQSGRSEGATDGEGSGDGARRGGGR